MAEPGDVQPQEVDERPQRRREWSGGFRSVVVPLLVVAAVIAFVWYAAATDLKLFGADGGAASEQVPAEPPDNPTGQPAAPEVNRAAPDFQLRTLDGGTVRLSDLRGRPVVINFWATWCPPCREEMPLLVDAHQAHQDQGLVILAVNVRESEGQARAFAEEFGLDFPVAMDVRGEVADRYRTYQFPESYFIDREGVIRSKAIGGMSAGDLAQRLTTILERGEE
ncbi:MAG TPA: TlpA disulfide reductase family protein [Dehalococcoidia bacterium]